MAGAQLGSQIYPGWGTAIGAIAGGALGAFSDRRLKTDIERIGALESGLPVYTFRFRGSLLQVIGVMADEVRKLFPHAVMRDPCGFDRVNYGAIR